MAIEEATLSVTCDECGSTHQIEMAWRFHSYSGNNGHYSYEATLEAMTKDGWDLDDLATVKCPDCNESADA